MNPLALRRDARAAHVRWRALVVARVPDDMPLPLQHAYWDAHDAARAEYAALDWRWQRLWLRVGVAALVVTFPFSWLTPLAAAFFAWRVLVVLNRLAPGSEK